MAQPSELGTERIGRLLFKYSLPAIIAMTASSLYNIVDSIFIGHFVGPLALGALTVAKPFMDVCAAFGSLVGVGAGSLLAIKLGEQDLRSAEKTLGNVILLNVVLGLLVAVVGIVFLDPILIAFGASEATLQMAYDYMFILLLGNIPTHLYFGLNNMLRASGHPKEAMLATITAVSINIVLDPIFIIVLDMGVRGAAIATVISQCIAVVWELLIFFRKDEIVRFHRGIWTPDWDITSNVLAIGLSPFLMNLAHCLVVVIVNNQLKNYGGDLAIAAYGVINRFTFVFAMIVMGLNQGMQPIVGYNYGARQFPRVIRSFQLTAICATVVTGMVFLLSEVCPELMARIFTHDVDLIELSAHALRIANCAFLIVGFQMVTGNFFTSIGMAKKAIFLSLTRQVLFLVPLIMLLPNLWGITGVWAAIPISDTLSAIAASLMLNWQLQRFRDYGNEQTIQENVEKYSEHDTQI